MGKIHYGPENVPGGFRMLPCSGRAVLRAAFTAKGNEVVARAGTDVTLDGVITAGDLIDVRAGQATAATGSINGTFYAELAKNAFVPVERILSNGGILGSHLRREIHH